MTELLDAIAKRDQIQAQAKDVLLSSLIRKKKAAGIIGTGVGKSKIAIDVFKDLAKLDPPGENDFLLIAVPNDRLRDTDWLVQIEKFGFRCKVVLECYQTIYRWVGRKIWAILADEFDFSITPEYSKVYYNNEFKYILGLTGTMADGKKPVAYSIAPIVFTYSTQDAQRDGILNPTKFYEVHFNLGLTPTIPLTYKRGGVKYEFKKSENQVYTYNQEAYDKAFYGFIEAEREFNSAQLLDGDTEHWADQISKYRSQMEYFSSKRRLLLHSLDSSRKVVQTLLETIHKEPRNRVLIFSALTAQADKITEYTYHLKNKKQNNLELFEKGQFNTLGVCQAINRGANLTGVNVIIKESYLGSDTDFQQQHGRGVRLDPGQTMYFITLVPQYLIQEKKEINGKTRIEWIRRPTQASAWAGKMTEKFHYEPEIIDMVHDARNDTYKLPEGYDNLCQSY